MNLQHSRGDQYYAKKSPHHRHSRPGRFRRSAVLIGINALYLIPGKAGGLETVVRNFLSSIRSVDSNNEYILFSNREGSGSFVLPSNIREVPCPLSATFRPGKHLWEQFILPFWLRKYRVEVLLSPGNVTPLCAPCPSVSVINDAVPFIHPENFTFGERFSLKILFHLSSLRSSAIITLSESAKRDLVRHLRIRPERVHVVHLAAEDRFHPITAGLNTALARYGIKRPYIVCVSSSRPYKNVVGAIRAFSLLKRQHRVPHQLVVTGLSGRAHREVMQAAAPMVESGDLVFTGFVDDGDLPTLYSGATASVYPSFYEGFGLPVLESMACGTPVVSSNAASLPEVVGDAGVLFDPYNISGIADAIASVLLDPELHAALREKGFERVRQFSWDRATARIIDILASQVARPVAN